MASFLNNIIGNPFTTPVGQLIEKATNSTDENWALFMEICDRINSTEEGPKDAIKAFKKQLSNSTADTKVFLTTLTVLETCVKNCGFRFHTQLAQKDVLQEFTSILLQKATPPVDCVDRVLGLLQTWADAFQGDPDLQEVSLLCKELKVKGFIFPVEDVEHAPPIHTPARKSLPPTKPQAALATTTITASTLSSNNPTVLVPPLNTKAHSITSTTTAFSTTNNTPVSNSTPPSINPQLAPVTAPSINTSQLNKLKSELKVVLQNCKIFSQLLTENSPGQEEQEDWLLMKDLASTSNECHRRLVELVGNYTIEQLTGLVLPVNDEVTNLCLRFERYERVRRGVLERKGRLLSAATAAGVAGTAVAAGAAGVAGSFPAASASTVSDQRPAGLDDDDDDDELVDIRADSGAIQAGKDSTQEAKRTQEAFNPFADLPVHSTNKPREVELSTVTADFRHLNTSVPSDAYTKQEFLESSGETAQDRLASTQDFENFLESKSGHQSSSEREEPSHETKANDSNDEL